MLIYFGSDRTGYSLKNILKDYVQSLGHEVIDLGVFEEGTMSNADIAREVAEKIYENIKAFGVLTCGVSTGMCMVANKHPGVRAVDCSTDTQAHYARSQNDANVLCLSENLLGVEVAKRILKVFLTTEFGNKESVDVGESLEGLEDSGGDVPEN